MEQPASPQMCSKCLTKVISSAREGRTWKGEWVRCVTAASVFSAKTDDRFFFTRATIEVAPLFLSEDSSILGA